MLASDIAAGERSMLAIARSSAERALGAYLQTEGDISEFLVYTSELPCAIEAVCGLTRVLEHLVKLRLWRLDPVLVFGVPGKTLDYAILRGIPIPGMTAPDRAERLARLTNRTIAIADALPLAAHLSNMSGFNWGVFGKLCNLRNAIEHGWHLSAQFVREVLGHLGDVTLPAFHRFIKEDLRLEPSAVFCPQQLAEVERLQRAIKAGHSLVLQQRLEKHLDDYARIGNGAARLLKLPERYAALETHEVKIGCPVCSSALVARWKWEADYDRDPIPVGVFPSVECLQCVQCGFYVDGSDVETYLPEGIDIDPGEYFADDYIDDLDERGRY